MRKGEARKTAEFDVLQRIETEKEKRGWSDYQLAQRAEINQSIISTWKKRSIEPSLASIEILCNAFGITLSQFFENKDSDSFLNSEQRELISLWEQASPIQRNAVLAMLDAFIHNK